MLESLLEFLIQGVVLGGLYALFAVGLSLIFGVLDVINVAHGEFFAIGGYLAFGAVVLLHLPGAMGVLGAAVGTFLLGLCVYPLLIAPLKRRLGGRPQGPLYLVLTLGLSTFLQSSLLALAGGDYLRVPPQLTGILALGVTAVSYQRLLVLGVARLVIRLARWVSGVLRPSQRQSLGVVALRIVRRRTGPRARYRGSACRAIPAPRRRPAPWRAASPSFPRPCRTRPCSPSPPRR